MMIRRDRIPLWPAVTVILLPIWLCTSLGRTIYVDANGTGDYPTIQAAIDDANDGDVVIVAPGIYTGDGNRDIEFRGKAITVRSIDPNDPNIVAASVIDCNGTEQEPHRGFHFKSGEEHDSVLSGVKITNGWAPNGGGIFCRFYPPSKSNPTICHCIITNNQAGYSSSSWGDGGGIACGKAKIINCAIVENSADFQGGGISCGSGTTLEGCIIAKNLAGDSGGGIYARGGRLVILNCTIADNSASRGSNILSEGSNITMTNTILWSDNGTGLESDFPQTSYFDFSFCDIKGGKEAVGHYYDSLYWGSGNIDVDPSFVNPAVGNYHLSPDSPCIESGDPCVALVLNSTDISGNPRLAGDCIDMGAYEYFFQTPFVGVSAKVLEFVTCVGEPSPESQKLTIRNIGTNRTQWDISEDCVWMSVTPSQGESFGETGEAIIVVDTSELERGLHICELTITSNEAVNSPVIVSVLVYVNGQIHVPSEYPTIQDAIDAAIRGDIVIIAEGTYAGIGNRDIDLQGKAITVQSTDPLNLDVVTATVIDCQGSSADPHRGFCFHSYEGPDTVVSGLTITNGYGLEEYFGYGSDRSCGGAIFFSRASPTISQCRIIGNQAGGRSGVGGGIACRGPDCTPTIYNCKIINNSAGRYGGGIAWRTGSVPRISKCLITGNSAGEQGGGIYFYISSAEIIDCIVNGNSAENGGGIYCYHGSYRQVDIRGCIIKDNSTSGDGGGIYFDSSNVPLVDRSIIIGNSAENGGGIRDHSSSPVATRSIFLRNYAKNKGGGMYTSSGLSNMYNCTVVSNSAQFGGGICYYYGHNPRVTNSIVWNNLATEGSQIAVLGVIAGPKVAYSNVQGDEAAVFIEDSESNDSFVWDRSNTNMDPLFALEGHLDPNGTPEDPNDDFWVDGDYHLQSQAGRWDPNSQSWVKDDVTSPCIDAGDPMSPIGLELFPNGGRINMGAYGGTVEASKSYFGGPICETILAGDINGDCKVDFADFKIMALHWLNDHTP